jgi:adenine deaminase
MVGYLHYDVRERASLLAVARGEVSPDMVVVGGTVADVHCGDWVKTNVEIKGVRIAYVGQSQPRIAADIQVVDATGRRVVPWYTEPHCHPRCVYNPISLLEAALTDGVTTLVYDDLPFHSALGERVTPCYGSSARPASQHLLDRAHRTPVPLPRRR